MDWFCSDAFSARVELLMEQHRIPGLSIAVIQDDEISSAGYGKASIEPSRPCTADTLFDIASASKSLTAASVALLVDDDTNHPAVQWEAKMSSLLPGDFVMSEQAYTDDVTVEDILSHRTGLPSSYMSTRAKQPDDVRSVTRNLRNLAVAAPIRSKFFYCNIMYTVATYLVEVETKLPFADFLEQRFFGPLNMAATNLQPGRARARGFGERIAAGYHWDEQQDAYTVIHSREEPEAQGAGSINTSVNDYARYVKALMNQEAPFNEDIYNGLLKQRMITDSELKDLNPLSSPDIYCAGWEVSFYRGHKIVQHGGGVPGFKTNHFFLPDFKFGGVVFGNSDGASVAVGVLTHELIDEALKVSQAERPDWHAIEVKRDEEYEQEVKDEFQKVRTETCPESAEPGWSPSPQRRPLDAYTGGYHNPGYHGITLEVKDGKLFADATDRCMGFRLIFEHVCDQTKYEVRLVDFLDGSETALKAEFVFAADNHEDGDAVRVGISFEEDLEELIWFDRVK